jgi:hypothetical protein
MQKLNFIKWMANSLYTSPDSILQLVTKIPDKDSMQNKLVVEM